MTDVLKWSLWVCGILYLSRNALAQDTDAWLAVINNNNNIEEPQQQPRRQEEYRPPPQQTENFDGRRQGQQPDFEYDENQALDAPSQRLPPPPRPAPRQPPFARRPPPPPQAGGQFQRPPPQRAPPGDLRYQQPAPPKKQGILEGIGGAITGAVNDVTCAAQGLYAEDKLQDPAFINYQLQCLMDRGECDEIGRLVKRMAPDILRGGCPPPCDPCKKKQIQKVMGTLSRKYPMQFQDMIRKFGK